MEDLRLDGRIAVVTGAASGIGLATSARLAKLGARVAGLDLDGGEGELSIRCDITDASAVRTAMAEVENRIGPATILVNSAGIAPAWKPFEELDEAGLDRVLSVNVKGSFLCAQAVVPSMKRSGKGAIVNIASVAGRHRSLASDASYTASKGAVISLTRHLANELIGFGIRVNCVCPGPIDSPMLRANLDQDGFRKLSAGIPAGRPGTPDEIAAVVCFLAADASSYMVGSIVDANGGIL